MSPITSWDASKYDCRFAAQVKDFEPRKHFFNEKDARRADRYSQLAMASAKEAVKHAGLDPQQLQLDRVGVLVGSGIGGLKSLGDQDENLHHQGPEPRLALHDSDDDQQHGRRADLDGIRLCRAQFFAS